MTSKSTVEYDRESSINRIRIVLATENRGKVTELRSLVGDITDVVDLGAFSLTLPPETGSSFAKNAIAKAAFASEQTGLIAIADDSGLEVDALMGLPGVRTARFAGEYASDAQNRAKLLSAMAHVPDGDRRANFVSVIAISRPEVEANVLTATGCCHGSIAHEERGTHGFGYDSIFQIPDGRMMAELTSEQKNAMSHRGAAMRRIVPLLRELLAPSEAGGC
jgi:XTP/dITP diphosphohydrolase